MNLNASRPLLLIGLTGGIGSGKTTVANRFGALGVPLIDTDLIAHQLTGPGGPAMPAIEAEFGPSVIAADGRLDRDAMRALAFGDPGARKRLEAILHPMIRVETDRQVAAAASSPYAIVVIPLLVESKGPKRFDRIVVVDCPVDTQIERVMKRNGLPRAQVEAILAVQATRAQRLAAADDVVDNGGEPGALQAQIEALHRRYLAFVKDGALLQNPPRERDSQT